MFAYCWPFNYLSLSRYADWWGILCSTWHSKYFRIADEINSQLLSVKISSLFHLILFFVVHFRLLADANVFWKNFHVVLFFSLATVFFICGIRFQAKHLHQTNRHFFPDIYCRISISSDNKWWRQQHSSWSNRNGNR